MKSAKHAIQRKIKVTFCTITEDQAGQRIDNFLINLMKGVPKSHIYRIIRKGEVRVNKKRIAAFYRLLPGDSVRLPPVITTEKAKNIPPSEATMLLLKKQIIYEDDQIIIINKPSGMSVHAGTTVRVGVIEAMRHLYPRLPHLELGHRLDSETSGCLILAKKKRVLREIHGLLREGKITKIYWALTQGHWKASELTVDVRLHKHYRDGGKHVVEVDQAGKTALTIFHPLQTFQQAALMEVRLHTGRTHQIRVHASHQGHPIAGDDRYGDTAFNKEMRQQGLKRLFLHAYSLDFVLPSTGQRITVTAPLGKDLNAFLDKMKEA
jgi:23S rRNA pseudouridine955/2504/2580 synthase